MQSDLAKIGVNAKLVTYEWANIASAQGGGHHRPSSAGPATMAIQIISSPGRCTDGKPPANNIPKWCNSEFSDLLAKARVIPDQAGRAKLYERMQSSSTRKRLNSSSPIRPYSRSCAPM